MSAGDLSDPFDVSKPTMSAHFAVMKEAGLLFRRFFRRVPNWLLVIRRWEPSLVRSPVFDTTPVPVTRPARAVAGLLGHE
jgi:DNA-binding transcriptional ArsR family regulator